MRRAVGGARVGGAWAQAPAHRALRTAHPRVMYTNFPRPSPRSNRS